MANIFENLWNNSRNRDSIDNQFKPGQINGHKLLE